MKIKRQEIICVLDIGSTKVCCCIASVSKNNVLIIHGLGCCSCTGIASGVIIEMESVCKSVSTAIELAEAQAKCRVESVYVSTSGKNINTYIKKYEKQIGGRLISENDIVDMLRNDDAANSEYVILHKIPIIFSIDGMNGIKNPKGMVAERIGAHVSIIEAKKTQVSNLFICLSKCHLRIDGIIAGQYASGFGIVDDKDTEDNRTTLIDFSGSNTSISFWYNGALCGIIVIPIGGGHITKDLCNELCVSYADAERLKVLYGSAMSSNYEDDDSILAAMVSNTNHIDMQQVSKETINKVVQQRLDNLTDLVVLKISNSEFSDFANRFIVTGGASQFPGMLDLLTMKLKKNVQRKSYEDIICKFELTPNYATIVGLLKYAMKDRTESKNQTLEKYLQKLFSFFRTES